MKMIIGLVLALACVSACGSDNGLTGPGNVPTALWTQAGSGDNVFTVPTYVTKLRVDATYPGDCQNFMVHISTQAFSLVNTIIGTCSVAETRSPFTGTYAIAGGGQVSITNSTGVSWLFTEVR